MRSNKKANIVVFTVDDDQPVCEMLADWLKRSATSKCLGAYQNVEQALGHLPAGQMSLIVMDVIQPEVNSFEGDRTCASVSPQTRSIILRMYEAVDGFFLARAGASSKQTPGGKPQDSRKSLPADRSLNPDDIAPKRFDPESFSARNLKRLSAREREVLELLAQGFHYKEVGRLLGVRITTVNTHVRRIYEKLGVHSRAQAVARFSHFSLDEPVRMTQLRGGP